MFSRNPLLNLILAIPIVVLLACLAAFLMLRAGFGLLVAGVLPFLGLTLAAGALGLLLGRAAEKERNRERD